MAEGENIAKSTNAGWCYDGPESARLGGNIANSAGIKSKVEAGGAAE
jgi:hypothetical protein